MNKELLNNKYVRLLAMSLVIIVAISFIQDFADFLDNHSERVVKLGTNNYCDPMHSVCSASIVNKGEFQRLSLLIKPLDPQQKEYLLSVTASGFDFEGIESLAVILTEQEDHDVSKTILLSPDPSDKLVVPEKWLATGKIDAGGDQKTAWLATIRLKSTQKEYQAEFLFKPE